MAGLFDTFNISLRGLNVQQSNINTSAHNVANASTEGYSRQRSVSETTKPFGGMSKWDVCTAGQIGTGAQITAIQRIRNIFLDYQVREKITDSGTSDVKYSYLYQAEGILDDSSNSGIQSALNNFFNAFQDITTSADKNSSKKTALSQADALATTITSKYTQLETKKQQMQQELGNYVTDINNKLDQINALNQQISSVAVVGMSPNDLMDQRDLLLDQLSQQFGINVDRDSYDTINLKMSEDDFSITTGSGDDEKRVDKLVSAAPKDDYLRFSYISSVEREVQKDGSGTPQYDADGNMLYTEKIIVRYNKLGDPSKQETFEISGVNNDNKAKEVMDYFSENRVLLTDKDGVFKDSTGKKIGENGAKVSYDTYTNLKKQMLGTLTKGQIAGNVEAQKDIQASMDELDVMAASLAYTVNAVHTGLIDGTNPIKYSDGSDVQLIFVTINSKGEQINKDNKVNAKNIALNQEIYKDPSKLLCGTDADSGEKDSTRAQAIADIASLKIDFSKIQKLSTETDTKAEFLNSLGIKFITGSNETLQTYKDGTTIKDYYTSITNDLGTKVDAAKKENTTNTTELQQYEEQRQSESGVSLDEEMTDMIIFQRAYQANAKVMNTVDQLLEVVINGLKA